MARGATSGRRIADKERVAQALVLRKAGASYQQIAEQCGYNDRSAAHHSVTRALRAMGREDAEDVLELELARLDDMTTAVWPVARRGDLKAIDTVLKLQDRRAKYLGLDSSEARTAAAAERIAGAQETQVSVIYAVMTSILGKLNLTPEQQAAAPAIIVGELDQLANTTSQEHTDDDDQ